MSKKKVINGKDYRWDYQKKKWVQSHGSSGMEALGGLTRSVVGLFNRDKAKIKKNGKSNGKTKVTDHKDTGHTKLVKDSSGKVKRVKVSDTTKDKTLKGSNTSKMKSKPSGSTVHTRHYKTGERLGVMTRSQRRAYDKEAAGRSFESEVAKHEKSSGHGKSHLRETLYKKSLRKKKTPVSKGKSPEKVEITKNKNEFKVAPKDIPAGKVKMKDGSIVDRSSLYKKKKK